MAACTLAPTLLDATGLKVPADVQGRSPLPILGRCPPKEWRTAMYYRSCYRGERNISPQ